MTGERGRAFEVEVTAGAGGVSRSHRDARRGSAFDGGSDLAYMTYAAQLRAKEEMVRDAFCRIGAIN